jgi:hypothetical protein
MTCGTRVAVNRSDFEGATTHAQSNQGLPRRPAQMMAIRSQGMPPSRIDGASVLAGGVAVAKIFRTDVTFTPGSIAALVATVKTVAVTGLLTTDAVAVNCIDGLGLGAVIANTRVSAADTLEITFTTAVAIGVTLGSLAFRVTVFR